MPRLVTNATRVLCCYAVKSPSEVTAIPGLVSIIMHAMHASVHPFIHPLPANSSHCHGPAIDLPTSRNITLQTISQYYSLQSTTHFLTSKSVRNSWSVSDGRSEDLLLACVSASGLPRRSRRLCSS